MQRSGKPPGRAASVPLSIRRSTDIEAVLNEDRVRPRNRRLPRNGETLAALPALRLSD